MRKIIIAAVFIAFLSVPGQSIAAVDTATTTPTVTQTIFSNVMDSAVNVLTNAANSLKTGVTNSVKLLAYKKQLELKQQELADVDKSTDFFIVKWCKKIRIRREIRDLERQIRELEAQL